MTGLFASLVDVAPRIDHEVLSKRAGLLNNNVLIAHAACASVGFMILLPVGAIIARYRTINRFWFNMHYAVQLIAGLLIIPGFGLGVHFSKSLEDLGAETHTKHKAVGKTLFGLYLAQVLVGLVIHYVKKRGVVHRPPQNYFHAVLGLVIIGMAMWQVHNGYTMQWPAWGATPEPAGVNKAWIAMAVILSSFYVIGLALLPRQYKRESETAMKNNESYSSVNMADVNSTTPANAHA